MRIKVKAVSEIMLTLFLMLTLSTVLVKPMVTTYPFEDIFKKDLLDLANGTPKIESIYIKSWMDTRPSGHLWAFIRINYTAGLSDHEKISVQDYVQRQLESKGYIDIVERNYYCVILIYPTPPVPWPGFVIGDLNVGFKSVTVAPVTHDIAIISVDPSSTSVKIGEPVSINVTVTNEGDFSETFNVTVYHDTIAIETKTNIALAVAEDKSLTFTWNTTDVREEIYATDKKEKTYAIKATATIAIDEDPDDNTRVSLSKVKVTCHYIAVVPKSTVNPNLTPGMNYTVSMYTDYNGSDVWGYEFTLTYNPLVLQGIEVANGDLINKEKDPSAEFLPGTFNNTSGELSNTAAFLFFVGPPIPLTFGPGILANVTFRVVGTGDSSITLGTQPIKPSRLIGINATTGIAYDIINDCKPGFYHILHGYFDNTPPPAVTATIDIHPYTLNLISKTKWITAYVQLPEEYDAEDIDATTILLNETIQLVLDHKYDFVANPSEYLVDHNEDGILERMVKFDRAEVTALLSVGEATLTLTGEVNGIPFEGSDSIKVVFHVRMHASTGCRGRQK